MRNPKTFIRCLFVFAGTFLMAFSMLNAQYVQLGTGMTQTGPADPSPVNTSTTDAHYQIIYTAAELQAAGLSGPKLLKELGWYVVTEPLNDLANYTIKMKLTTAQDVSSYDGEGLQEVYWRSSYLPFQGGFDTLVLDEALIWDGSSNILVNICYGQLFNTAPEGELRVYPAQNGMAYNRINFYGRCLESTDTLVHHKPQVLFKFDDPPMNDVEVIGFDENLVPLGLVDHPVAIRVRNGGTQRLTSLQIDWELNQLSQASLSWVGSLSFNDTTTILLDNVNFSEGQAYDLTAWTSLPNGNQDEDVSNDTASVASTYTGIEGLFTIGGNNPDFATISDAALALERGGARGATRFQIRSGTYNEQIAIGELPGAPYSYPVVFESESGDSSDVIIRYTPTGSADNFVLKLDGADGLNFRNLTFETGSNFYGIVIDIRGNADHNLFENNQLNGYPNTATQPERSIVYSQGFRDQFNVFRQNHFGGGGYGFYMTSSSANVEDREQGLIIEGNVFENQRGTAIRLTGQGEPHIAGNHISTNSFGLFYGIDLNASGGAIHIEKNHISAPNGGYGIKFNFCSGSANRPALLANNVIHIGGSTVAYGLDLRFSDFISLYYNSIHITGTATTSGRGINLSSCNDIDAVNNIFANSGGGYAIYTSSLASFSRINHNNYYISGTSLGFGSGAQADLAAWQAATGQDANSLSVDPMFVAIDDLHIQQTLLNGAGTPLAGITTDIDGELRDAQRPDIGADAISALVPDDAGITDIIGLEAPFASGNQVFSVVLRNFGQNPLTSVTINWSVNGQAQSPFNWLGNIVPTGQDTVQLGAINISDFTRYDLSVWSENPNNQSDTMRSNDSLHVHNLYAALAGDYTIGGSSPDFATAQEAIDLLTNGGVLAPVRMRFRPGTYPGPLVLNFVPGSSSNDSIVFEGENPGIQDVIISNNTAGTENILLEGGQHITLRNLKFERSFNTSVGLLAFEHGAHNNRLEGCTLQGFSPDAPGIPFHFPMLISSFDWQDTSIHIIDNQFIGGNIAMSVIGPKVSPESGWIIEGNRFVDQNERAIRIDFQSNLHVLQNHIETSSNNPGFAAMQIRQIKGDMHVERNRIVAKDAGIGLLFQVCEAPTGGEQIVANNMITTGNEERAYGISIEHGIHIGIYHNNILLNNSLLVDHVALRTERSNFIRAENNILHAGNGYALFESVTRPLSVSNNNALYTTGSLLAGNEATSYPDLAAWQAARGLDANSMVVDPLYVSMEDLHSQQVMLDSAANPLSQVRDDFDGEGRDQNYPDIGADERIFYKNDLRLVEIEVIGMGCDTAADARIRLHLFNEGYLPQTGFELAYRTGGGSWVRENVGGLSIAPFDTASFIFTNTQSISGPGTVLYDAFADLANDENRSNDSSLNQSFERFTQGNFDLPALPADESSDLDKPLLFSWPAAPSAQTFDLYIWEQGQAQPRQPQLQGLAQVQTTVSEQLDFGKSYQWQVVDDLGQCAGPIQRFSMKHLPDLRVVQIQLPPVAFTGKEISISWTIENGGLGSTESARWQESVYLSSDDDFDETDIFLGAVMNPGSLNPGQRYNQQASFKLPEGRPDRYFCYVVVDEFEEVDESAERNNTRQSGGRVFVDLTPPPDLQVTDIVSPTTAFADQEITIRYTVSNEGQGITNKSRWQDEIWLQADTSAFGQRFGREQYFRTAALMPDSSYTRSVPYILPRGISGTFYVYVKTNFLADVYEHSFGENNVLFGDSMTVVIAPPADLVVDTIIAPMNISSDGRAVIGWKVSNQGLDQTPTDRWADRLFISDSAGLDISKATSLIPHPQVDFLDKDSSYTVSRNVSIPRGLDGNYYLHVFADGFDQIDEFNREGNNVRTEGPFNLVHADLEVSSFVAPAMADAGSTIQIDWTSKNVGLGSIFNRSWTEAAYLSDQSVFHPDSSMILEESIIRSPLFASQDSMQHSLTASLPQEAQGNWFIHIVIDPDQNLYESADTSNNVFTASIQINPIALPDLEPLSLSPAADTLFGSEQAAFSYLVENTGMADATQPHWMDELYVSDQMTFDPEQAKKLGRFDRMNGLERDSSYSYTKGFRMPLLSEMGIQADTATIYAFINIDGKNELYEGTGEGNNVFTSTAFTLINPARPDLAISNVQTAASALAGTAIGIHWDVINQGASTAPWEFNYWTDACYLSMDQQLDPQDIFLKDFTTYGPLDMGEFYSDSVSVRLPNGLSGNFYILMVSDESQLLPDANRANNISVSSAIAINPGDPVDLRVKALSQPQTSFAAQPIVLNWTVENAGSGDLGSASWYDQFFLSTDFVIDDQDIVLGGKHIRTGLPAGSSYSQSDTLNLPDSLEGNFVLILKSDQNNSVYEHQAEGNNTSFGWISIAKAPPCDLLPDSVIHPDTAYVGEMVSIQWQLRNGGQKPANGMMSERLWLSYDTLVSEDDVPLSLEASSIQLGPEGRMQRSVNLRIPGGAVHQYYLLVQEDVFANIPETDESNNVSFGPKPIFIKYTDLPLASWKQDTLENSFDLYYQIEVPLALEDETMQISLKGDSLNGENQLFLSYNVIPSKSDFDFRNENIPGGNQTLTVPQSRPGTYYLLVSGTNRLGNEQEIRMRADILNFSLRAINTDVGGNNGKVTTLLRGADFQQGMRAQLQQNGQVIVVSDTIRLIDAASAYATFDLNGASLGLYDMALVKPGIDSVGLADAFTVEPGTGPVLITDIEHAPGVIAGQLVPVTFTFANQGNVDVPVPTRSVSSQFPAPIARSVEELRFGDRLLLLELAEDGGPPDILRPGATGSVTFYTKATARIRLYVFKDKK